MEKLDKRLQHLQEFLDGLDASDAGTREVVSFLLSTYIHFLTSQKWQMTGPAPSRIAGPLPAPKIKCPKCGYLFP